MGGVGEVTASNVEYFYGKVKWCEYLDSLISDFLFMGKVFHILVFSTFLFYMGPSVIHFSMVQEDCISSFITKQLNTCFSGVRLGIFSAKKKKKKNCALTQGTERSPTGAPTASPTPGTLAKFFVFLSEGWNS